MIALPNRSRIEIVALWTQLVLVLGDAVSLSLDAVAGDGHPLGWFFLPLLCVLPAAAAFRETRAAAIGVMTGAVASFAGFVWTLSSAGSVGWDAIVSALGLTWPLFFAAGLLYAALRNRGHREREASLLHKHAKANRIELEESEVCGCLACERIYSPTEIVRWIELSDGQTAVCPHCGIDSVAGSASGIPITPSVLRRAHERWFLIG